MKNNKNKWKIFSVALSLILIIVLTSGCLTADQEEQPHHCWTRRRFCNNAIQYCCHVL